MRELLTVSTRRVLGVAFPPFRYLAPLLTIWGLSMLLMIFMKDLGTSLLFFGALLALIYVATGRSFYVVTGAVLFARRGHRAVLRLPPRADAGWTSGSTRGRTRPARATRSCSRCSRSPPAGCSAAGWARATSSSTTGNTIIPALATDFIFSAIGEELGLVGAVGIILLYLIFAYRGLRIAMRARDDFSRLLATGLTTIFGLQAFIIIGGVIKLIPLTGITLPFVSYGGSSIVANFVLLALLLVTSDTPPGSATTRRGAGRAATGHRRRPRRAGRQQARPRRPSVTATVSIGAGPGLTWIVPPSVCYLLRGALRRA